MIRSVIADSDASSTSMPIIPASVMALVAAPGLGNHDPVAVFKRRHLYPWNLEGIRPSD